MAAYREWWTLAPMLGILLASSFGTCAQPAPVDVPAAPRFEIVRFAIDGNTLLKADELERAVAPYVGKQKDFSDIQRALETLEQMYRNRGYGLVQVLLPEQDITRGVVQFRVLEPRIGKVIVEGNKSFSTANVLASLPGLKPGTPPNSERIARNLQLLGEHPAKQTTVLLKAGSSDSEVDATVKITDEKPLKFVATIDNSGTDATGRFRTGFGMQHSNVFNRDHVLNLQYVTNPENPNKVTILGAGYRIPLYGLQSTLDVFAGYSDVDSGTLQELFTVSGSGTIFGVRYSHFLPKFAEYEHKVSVGLDYRSFKTSVLLSSTELVPDVTVHPLTVGYNGLWRMSTSQFGFYANYVQNIAGGNDGRDFDIAPYGFLTPARAEATAHYRIFRAGVNYSMLFAKEWQLRAVANGQYTADALVSSELFGFGGPDSVRGFLNREISNDKGYSASVEVYTPELGSKFGWAWKDLKARALAFYDVGSTARNKTQPGDITPGEDGASVGLGLRIAYGKSLNLRVDFANVIDSAGAQAKNDQMWNASLAILF
jgi:hemolysin activation/secretion protein